MNKKFACFAMALAMVAGLTACGEKESTTTGAFKIGTIGPLTGENAIYGQAVANGAKIAVDEINAAGGDIQFEIKSEDDVADGETSVNAYNNLMDWGMQVLVGPTTSGASIAVADVAYSDRTFMLTPSGSSTDIIAGKDNVFQVCFTDPNQGTGSADYMAENMADAKIAIIYRNDDPYSQGIRDTFVTEAGAKGLSVVYEGTFTADTATDFSVQLTGAQAAGADLLFLPIYYEPASLILSQAKAMGYAPKFFGVDGMDGILTMKNFDPALAEGVMLLTPFNADDEDEATQNFVKKYQEQYGETPIQFAADAYDCVYAYKLALETAGCTPDMSAAELNAKMKETFPTITFTGLTGDGAGITWDATGAVSKSPKGMVIQDGAYVGMD